MFIFFATLAEHNTIQMQVKTTKRKRNRQYRTEEQTRRENTSTSIQKVQNCTLFEQTTKLLHSTYTESVSPNLIFSSLTVWLCGLYKQENLSQNLFRSYRLSQWRYSEYKYTKITYKPRTGLVDSW